jgi:hypothetical protein
MPGPSEPAFFQVPGVAHSPLIHRKNSNFFEPDKIVILHKLIFYKLIRGAFVTLPRRKGPVPGPQPEPPVRLGFPVWAASVGGLILILTRRRQDSGASIVPALKFLGPLSARRPIVSCRTGKRGRPHASFPSLQAPALASSRPCKHPWRAADASSNPTCRTAQGLTINYNLVMFGAKTIGGDDLINFGMTYLPRRGNPPGLFCTPVRGGRHPRHAHLGRACRAQRRIKPTAATRKRESA